MKRVAWFGDLKKLMSQATPDDATSHFFLRRPTRHWGRGQGLEKRNADRIFGKWQRLSPEARSKELQRKSSRSKDNS